MLAKASRRWQESPGKARACAASSPSGRRATASEGNVLVDEAPFGPGRRSAPTARCRAAPRGGRRRRARSADPPRSSHPPRRRGKHVSGGLAHLMEESRNVLGRLHAPSKGQRSADRHAMSSLPEASGQSTAAAGGRSHTALMFTAEAEELVIRGPRHLCGDDDDEDRATWFGC
jgi:hypothetical protein